MLFLGNKIMRLSNDGGSLARRLFLLHFRQKVKEKDTELQARLKSELPLVFITMVRGYNKLLEYCKAAGIGNNIERILPRQVILNREALDAKNDSIRLYLLETTSLCWDDSADRSVSIDNPPRLYVPFDFLLNDFERWHKKRGTKPGGTTSVEWQTVLASTYPNCDFFPGGSDIRSVTLPYPRSEINNKMPVPRDGEFIQNLDLSYNCTIQEKDEFRNNKSAAHKHRLPRDVECADGRDAAAPGFVSAPVLPDIPAISDNTVQDIVRIARSLIMNSQNAAAREILRKVAVYRVANVLNQDALRAIEDARQLLASIRGQ